MLEPMSAVLEYKKRLEPEIEPDDCDMPAEPNASRATLPGLPELEGAGFEDTFPESVMPLMEPPLATNTL